MQEIGHFPMSEHPEQFRKYLLPVLDEIRGLATLSAAPARWAPRHDFEGSVLHRGGRMCILFAALIGSGLDPYSPSRGCR